ncbi:MAG: hypothetical protein FJY92_02135 [Candidatus Hydrogenedentes bacterium]|nr:hypothetical protein [Candidatus Hydrogenedentota bacterium]
MAGQPHNSGFAAAHDTYNGMGAGSDGKIYYVLSADKFDVGARMFSYDPATKTIAPLGDITEVCGEAGKKSIVQGKSHVNFVEANGKLYFSTHAGFYSIIDGMEKMGIPPAGWTPYPGGHVLAFDMKSGAFDDLGIPVALEGVLTTTMDTQRGRIYGITWPKGYFFRYDLAKKEFKEFGQISEQGEDGAGPAYRTLCRSITVNPADGAAYFTDSDGAIFRYEYDKETIAPVAGDNLKKDYFGLYDPTSPGHMGYNWRQTFWHAADKMIYGVHGNSGYLFRFDPAKERVEVLDRITSGPSKRSGMFDQFSYGYLGFTLGPDGNTIYYLTGGPIYEDGKRVTGKSATAMGEAKGLENLHLITYDIPTLTYRDRGAIFYPNGERPLYVNSIAVAKDGTVGFLARITENGKTRTDLVTVAPLKD